MKRFDWKYLPIAAVFVLSMALAPVFRAQEQSVTRFVVPDGVEYTIDGQTYMRSTSMIWPAGSKHIVTTSTPQMAIRTRYTFNGWMFGNVSWTLNPLVITASPSITEYRGQFDISYGLTVAFFNCPDPAQCQSPGSIYVNGTAVNSTTDIYIAANSTTEVSAFPNPGYVFVGWQSGANQVIQGYHNTITMTTPLIVYPRFQVARKVYLSTDPPELVLLADRSPVPTPVTLDWGIGSVHTVGANSPQKDQYGKWWSFQSWSDGGEANHAYTVESSSTPTALSAKFIPAAGVSILTQPVGLKIKVDGQYNALNPYYFAWGIGEKHHLEAPAQQTDDQGRVWQFSSWSNGGTATQDVVVPPDSENNGLRLTANYTQLTKVKLNSSLSGLSLKVDGVACATPCEVLRDPGSQVRVSAPESVPQGDSSRADFDGWPGGVNEYVIPVGNSAVSVSANYHLLNRLNAASDPVNGAVWTVLPGSPDGFYRVNSNVSVSLAAQPGYRFRRWDGDLSGTIPAGMVTMSAPRNVKALLDPIPYIDPAGVRNAAGTTPQTGVAPGGIISIFGVNLAADTVVAPEGVLPQTLGGLTVRIGDRLLPLFFVSPGQINAQLPDDLGPGDQVLTVSPTGMPDVRATFTVVRNAPGLFTMAIHEDGSPVTADAPAQAGELLTIYGTGLGPAKRQRPDGFPIPQSVSYAMVDGVAVQIGETSISAEKAFAMPGRCGIDAVQFRLDKSVTGTATLRVIVNGAESNTITLQVQ